MAPNLKPTHQSPCWYRSIPWELAICNVIPLWPLEKPFQTNHVSPNIQGFASGSWLGLSCTTTSSLAFFLLFPPCSLAFLLYVTKERDLLLIASKIEKLKGVLGSYWRKLNGGSGGSRGLSVWLCLPWVCSSWDKGPGRTASAAKLGWVDQSGGGQLPGTGFTTLGQTGAHEKVEEPEQLCWRPSSLMGMDVWSSHLGYRNHGLLKIVCSSQERSWQRRQEHKILVAIQTSLCPAGTVQPLLIRVTVDDEACEHTIGVDHNLWNCCYDMHHTASPQQ